MKIAINKYVIMRSLHFNILNYSDVPGFIIFSKGGKFLNQRHQSHAANADTRVENYERDCNHLVRTIGTKFGTKSRSTLARIGIKFCTIFRKLCHYVSRFLFIFF